MSSARKPTCFSGWEELPFSIGKFPKKSRKNLKGGAYISIEGI
jgi:hypothetical protein